MTIKLNAATGGGSVSLSAPNSTTSNLDVELTLPVDDGAANTFLKSDGSGTLSWAAASSDSITEGNTTVECVDTGSDGHITFDTEGSERGRFDSSGRLLVGTTSQVIAGSKVEIKGNGDGTGTGGKLTIAATDGWQDAGSLVGEINFANNSGGTPAIIRAEGDGFGGSGDYPGRLVFLTTPDSSSTPAERMRIINDGSVCINRTSASMGGDSGKLAVSGRDTAGGYAIICSKAADSGTSYLIRFLYDNSTGTGAIYTNSSTVTYATSSDYRLKENVVDLDSAIDRVKQLAPKRFNFIVSPDRTVDGFLAHEAQAVVPECVTGTHNEVEVWKEGEELPDGVSVGDNKLDEDGNTIPVYQGIDQAKLVPLLTAALQEAIGKIEALETANASLEARLTALEGGAS